MVNAVGPTACDTITTPRHVVHVLETRMMMLAVKGPCKKNLTKIGTLNSNSELRNNDDVEVRRRTLFL